MRAYPKYKSSDLPWLEKLPEHWELRRLKFTARINPPLSRLPENSSEVTFLPMEAVSTTGKIDCTRKRKASEVGNGFTCFERNDVIVAKITPCFENGKGAFLSELDADFGYGSTEFFVLRAGNSIRPRYLYYVTYADQFRQLGARSMTGSAGQQRVRIDFVGSFPCPLPPIAEQDAIVAFLAAKDADMQKFIAGKHRMMELLKEQKTALIHRAVTRGLKPNVALKPTGIPCIPEIPHHWFVRANGALFRERNETGYPDLPVLAVSLNTAVTVEDFAGDRPKRLIEDRAAYKRACKGDLAYNMMRMWQGAVGEVPCDGLVSPAYVVARPVGGTYSAYFAHLFRTAAYKTDVNRQSRGIVTDRNRLYWDDFKQMKSPVPPPQEQAQIVEFIVAKSTEINQALAAADREIALMEEYRTALIAAAVTGQIHVRTAV